MSRSPAYEDEGGDPGPAPGPEVALRIGLGAIVKRGTIGLRVRPMRGSAAERSSDHVRWAMMENQGPAKLLLPGEKVANARVTLVLEGDAPDLRRRDFGPALRPAMSFRVQVGDRSDWFIVVIPTTGLAWDGKLVHSAGQFASYAAEKFLRFAVPNWPTSGPLRFNYGPRVGPDTRLRMMPMFPPRTPMLTAGRNLERQLKRRGLAGITFLAPGLRIGLDGCIRQVGPVHGHVQWGCTMGLAVDPQGESKLVCIYVPNSGTVSPRDSNTISRRLADRRYEVFQRRKR